MKTALISLLFVCSVLAASNVAVQDLQGKGIKQSEASIISDKLRSDLS